MGTILIQQKLFVNEKANWKTIFKKQRKNIPFCKVCGRTLKDPESISRGIGKECLQNATVAIVFDIRPDKAEANQ